MFRFALVLALVPALVGIITGGHAQAEAATPGPEQPGACGARPGHDGSRFAVLLADFSGDSDARLTRQLAESLDGSRSGLALIRLCKELALDGSNRSDIVLLGRRWLESYGADLLAWGQVNPDADTIQLRFLSRQNQTSRFILRHDGNIGPDDLAALRGKFLENLFSRLSALVQAEALPTGPYRAAPDNAEGLIRLTDKISRLLDPPPPGMPLEVRSAFNRSLGIAANIAGSKLNDVGRLEQALAAFRAALKETSRRAMPTAWAATQNSLGQVLEQLSLHDQDTARLEEAIAAYRSAATEYNWNDFDRGQLAGEWVRAQRNIAHALINLGERRQTRQPQEQAIETYRAALDKRVRLLAPQDWAQAQIEMGELLYRLGDTEQDVERLKEAIAAFQAAQEVQDRESAPIEWAEAQDRRGAGMLLIARWTRDQDTLRESIRTLRMALEERTRDKMPREWADTQGRLAEALWLSGRTSGENRADAMEALSSYRAALAVIEQLGDTAEAGRIQARIAEMEAALGDL